MECLAKAAPPYRLPQSNNIRTSDSLAKLSLGVRGHEITIGECSVELRHNGRLATR